MAHSLCHVDFVPGTQELNFLVHIMHLLCAALDEAGDRDRQDQAAAALRQGPRHHSLSAHPKSEAKPSLCGWDCQHLGSEIMEEELLWVHISTFDSWSTA